MSRRDVLKNLLSAVTWPSIPAQHFGWGRAATGERGARISDRAKRPNSAEQPDADISVRELSAPSELGLNELSSEARRYFGEFGCVDLMLTDSSRFDSGPSNQPRWRPSEPGKALAGSVRSRIRCNRACVICLLGTLSGKHRRWRRQGVRLRNRLTLCVRRCRWPSRNGKAYRRQLMSARGAGPECRLE